MADRIQLLVDEPRRSCSGSPDSPGAVVVHRRLAVLDAEIDRLTRLRSRLARRTSGAE
ncbi:hypothetical protein SAMN06272765_6250 [Streptomyces sp. Ag109_G2-15]|nr:hypothetical protein SAMN06272765_6250 [Streptomyces sp. Ag109_G2-15]